MDSLNTELSRLADILSPLLEQQNHASDENQLENMLSSLGTPLHKAKLDALVAKTIYDLTLTYLQLKGIDTTQHPAHDELERIKSHFEKLHHAEFGAPSQTYKVDKEAASRFLKHSLPKQQ